MPRVWTETAAAKRGSKKASLESTPRALSIASSTMRWEWMVSCPLSPARVRVSRGCVSPSRSLAAALAARQALAAANRIRLASGAEALDFGVALHVGRVVYGNIGGQGRLDFTVIGQAVNLVSRVEGLCRSLDQPLLATAALARHVEGELVPLGLHQIRGLPEPVELFGLPPAAA
jgi:class 3 adenylate cyclase